MLIKLLLFFLFAVAFTSFARLMKPVQSVSYDIRKKLPIIWIVSIQQVSSLTLPGGWQRNLSPNGSVQVDSLSKTKAHRWPDIRDDQTHSKSCMGEKEKNRELGKGRLLNSQMFYILRFSIGTTSISHLYQWYI